MKLDLFSKVIPEHYDDFHHPTRFIIPKYQFKDEERYPPGYTTPFIGYLLNFAVSLLEPNEAHLQIGTFCQRTLAYAMTNQLKKVHYLLADFSQNRSQKRTLEIWLAKCGLLRHLHVIDGDYQKMLSARPPVFKEPIGVCFYDVQPDYELQIQNLQLLKPHLAKEALIIIDDANWGTIRAATKDWLAKTPEAKLLFDLPTPINGYSTWWNGLQIIGYRKTAS